MVDDALRAGGRLRCLAEINPAFTGMTPPAAADDLRLGLPAFWAVAGIAVVTGIGWIVTATRWAGFLNAVPTAHLQPSRTRSSRRGGPVQVQVPNVPPGPEPLLSW